MLFEPKSISQTRAIQVLLYEALGYKLPEFAHLPFVAAPGGKKKLSKRNIAAYRKSPAFQKLFQLGDTVLSALGHDPKTCRFRQFWWHITEKLASYRKAY